MAAVDETSTMEVLGKFSEKWDSKYPQTPPDPIHNRLDGTGQSLFSFFAEIKLQEKIIR